MDKITRYFKKVRHGNFEQTFPFTTYDVIFDSQASLALPKSALIFEYLKDCFCNGAPNREMSASNLPALEIEKRELFNHEYSKLAGEANYKGAGNRQHAIVENYFLDNHPDCIAIEFPIFDDKISGFGDILLIKERPFEVNILDFKPEAAKEKYAPTQLYYYRKMFCDRTGINPSEVNCFYFDDLSCFQILFSKQQKNNEKN